MNNVAIDEQKYKKVDKTTSVHMAKLQSLFFYFRRVTKSDKYFL